MMARGKSYPELLKDPRWQKKRLEILERDNWKCIICANEKQTLHVHHLAYHNHDMPWDCDDKFLITLCETCHVAIKNVKFTPSDIEIIKGLKRRKEITWLRELILELGREEKQILLGKKVILIRRPVEKSRLDEHIEKVAIAWTQWQK